MLGQIYYRSQLIKMFQTSQITYVNLGIAQLWWGNLLEGPSRTGGLKYLSFAYLCHEKMTKVKIEANIAKGNEATLATRMSASKFPEVAPWPWLGLPELGRQQSLDCFSASMTSCQDFGRHSSIMSLIGDSHFLASSVATVNSRIQRFSSNGMFFFKHTISMEICVLLFFLHVLWWNRHDVCEGQVMVNGQDVRKINQRSLRAAIGMVPQDESDESTSRDPVERNKI